MEWWGEPQKGAMRCKEGRRSKRKRRRKIGVDEGVWWGGVIGEGGVEG